MQVVGSYFHNILLCCTHRLGAFFQHLELGKWWGTWWWASEVQWDCGSQAMWLVVYDGVKGGRRALGP